jgi:protein SCO1/2
MTATIDRLPFTGNDAAAKRDVYLRRHARAEGAEAGVHFLTGRQTSIDAVANAIGFRYAYDKAIDQYAHPALVTVLTPDGRVSRYLFGIEFAPIDMRLALLEAADRKVGSVADVVLLFCYHYDPETGQYGFAILNFVRLAGALTVAALGTFIFVTLRRERRQGSAVKPTATGIR